MATRRDKTNGRSAAAAGSGARAQRAPAAALPATAPALRIAAIDAALQVALPAQALVARCIDLGFDALLLRDPVPDNAAALQASGLALLREVRIDLFAGSAGIVRAQPHWFRTLRDSGDHLPDPRRPQPVPGQALARFEDPECAGPLLEWWVEQLGEWFAAGLTGVCCAAPQALPAAQWRELIETCRRRHPRARFMAWTPGLAAGATDALQGAGFDAVFSSLPWWDFRAGWLFEEDARLRRLGRVIAPVDPPGDTAISNAASDHAAWRRRLLFGALAADGILVALRADDLTEAGDAAARLRTQALREANAWLAAHRDAVPVRLRPLLHGSGPALAVLVEPLSRVAAGTSARLLLVNADDDHVAPVDCGALVRAGGIAEFAPLHPAAGAPVQVHACTALEPGEVRAYVEVPARPVLRPRGRDTVRDAVLAPRVAIGNPAPVIDGGRYPVKRTVGDLVTVEADIFSDGHEHLAAVLVWRAADARGWEQVPMRQLGNDRWRAEFPLARTGRHQFAIEAWRDRFGSLHAEIEAKRGAGNLSALDVGEAVALVEAAAARGKGTLATQLRALLRRLRSAADDEARAALLLEPETAQAMARSDERPFLLRSTVFEVDTERRAARFASWYELFPRSQSGDAARHGSFDDVIAQLPRIRDMGFDVLYMPPIHPIGQTHRKGRNNSLTAQAGEPGSPYAIGSAEGGHDAIHPQLGTLADFARLREAAAAQGLELALDFAIQCSPDHPWLREHPGWFAWRADGSVRYAENPPKKYQDIVNVDFYAEGAIPGLWLALRDVVLFWVEQGVLLFRVDNPHTKPYAFWEWMIAEVRARHPDVVFLSEAFTRPRPMYHLAKLGFSQSYTYFTWRHGKQEFIDFMQELADGAPRDFYRPHLFVNTPDINPAFLQKSGRSGHLIRAALATTLSGLWGMYSGFELCEATPLAPGKEEYLDSEKFELRAWDWQRPGNIVAEITRLNLLRRLHPALQTHLGIRFYNAFNDQVLYFGKRAAGEDSMLLVAICLDPFHAQHADFEVPLWEWDLPDDGAVDVEDLWYGRRLRWHGKVQHLHLDPHALPFALWRIAPVRGHA